MNLISFLNLSFIDFTRNLEKELTCFSVALFLDICRKFTISCVPNIFKWNWTVYFTVTSGNLIFNERWGHVFSAVSTTLVAWDGPSSIISAISLFVKLSAQNTELCFVCGQNTIEAFGYKRIIWKTVLGAFNIRAAHVSERELVEYVSWFMH